MISVLLATTGRPELAIRCVAGIRETTEGHDVEIVAAVDADPESRDLLAPMVDQMLYSDEYRGSSRAWNEALAVSLGDPIILAADDLIWQPGWLDAALKTLSEFPDGWGFVGFNDGHWGEELSTHWLVSRRLIREAFGGVVTWEFYEHSFQDREANERARRAGRYAWCSDAHVHHEHWIFGDRSQDATDTRNLAAHGASEQIFQRRLAAGFPNDFKAVI